MRTKRGATAAAGLLAIAAGLVAPSGASALRQRVFAHVEADSAKTSRKVPDSFLGLSVEFHLARGFVALPKGNRANPPYVQLSRKLAGFGSGVPMLRIGGGSTDSTYLQNGLPHPPGTTVPINTRWRKGLSAFVSASGTPLIIGINLGQNRPDLASRFAQVMLRDLPPGSVRAFEIGNEPDIYQRRPLYPGKMTRPKNYGPKQYLRELPPYVTALQSVAPTTALAGPAVIPDYKWVPDLARVISAEHRRIKLMTMHRYPLQACDKTPGKRFHTRDLLGRVGLEDHYRPLVKYVALARHYHQRLRLTESNSIACGGAAGVSNALAAALWGTDWLFMNASLGVAGVDFHTASPLYSPFNPAQGGSRNGVDVHPLYFAMLLFAEATAHHAQILKSTYGAGRESKGSVHAWATYDAVDGVVRVVINKKFGRHAGYVVVHVPGATGDARLKRLRAPNVNSTDVTWGGQRFAQPTLDGQLVGRLRVQTSTRRPGSKFRVRMPRTGIALLTVPVRPR